MGHCNHPPAVPGYNVGVGRIQTFDDLKQGQKQGLCQQEQVGCHLRRLTQDDDNVSRTLHDVPIVTGN